MYLPEFHLGVDALQFAVTESLGAGESFRLINAELTANTPPTATDDAYATGEGTQLVVPAHGVLDNDSDIESAILTAGVISGPSNGSLVLNADGSFTYDPDVGFSGADAFTYEVCDEHGLCSQADADITVDAVNTAPTIDSLTCPTAPVALDTPVAVTVTFSDPDADDSHDAVIYWGDAETTTVNAAVSPVEEDHTYAAAGIHQVSATVTDAAGESDDATCDDFVVVYDPAGGFVTGGGWVWSPLGAFPADPGAEGKAKFGFVSKYKKGAATPTGATQFEFVAGNLYFTSDTYDWLVIAGSKAMYKGVGEINGAGAYRFMLSAIDGDLNGGDGIDKFRIKIWEETGGGDVVIYDNQIGAAEDDDPTTGLGGGSIVIHKAKGKG
jgi:hypothetical protein